MKKILTVFLLLLTSVLLIGCNPESSNGNGGEELPKPNLVAYKFTVLLPRETPIGDKIYLVGEFGHPSMEDWDDGLGNKNHEMDRDGFLATLTINYEKDKLPERIEYKFTHGNDWIYVEKGADREEVENRVVLITNDKKMDFVDIIQTWNDIESQGNVLIKNSKTNYDIYYQIYVRSFADSNGDGIGDLNGITENLDYLEELGITGIWMMPIHTTDTDWASLHGYRVKDYYDINPDYGTMADFENLITEAHNRGIKIMIDFVVNHTSDRHPWYWNEENDSATGTNLDYYYSGNPVFDGGFKDLDLNNARVELEIKNIVSFYSNKGVDGYRIDAAKHLYDFDKNKNRDQKNAAATRFLDRIKTHAETINPDVFFVGEYFEKWYPSYSKFYEGVNSMFDFYVLDQIYKKIGDKESPDGFLHLVKNAYNTYYISNPNYIPSIFISNHDLEEGRIASSIEFTTQTGEARQRLAASVMLTLPGTPHIYYGEEIGMKGEMYNGFKNENGNLIYDQYIRSPFLWGDESKQTTWLPEYGLSHSTISVKDALTTPNSLLKHYQELITLRKNNPALMYGNTFDVWGGTTGTLQGLIREFSDDIDNQKVLIVYNISNSPQTVNVPYNKILYGSLNVPAFGMVVLEID